MDSGHIIKGPCFFLGLLQDKCKPATAADKDGSTFHTKLSQLYYMFIDLQTLTVRCCCTAKSP